MDEIFLINYLISILCGRILKLSNLTSILTILSAQNNKIKYNFCSENLNFRNFVIFIAFQARIVPTQTKQQDLLHYLRTYLPAVDPRFPSFLNELTNATCYHILGYLRPSTSSLGSTPRCSNGDLQILLHKTPPTHVEFSRVASLPAERSDRRLFICFVNNPI